jgi:hypothetical protein
MSAHCNDQAHCLYSQPADHKSPAPRGVRKQDQRSESEKESGWHHQQSGVLHGLSFSGFVSVETAFRSRDPFQRVRNARHFNTENDGLQILHEF